MKLFAISLICLAFICTVVAEQKQRKMLLGRRRGKGLLIEPPKQNRDQTGVKTMWFEQKLDHFNAGETRMWRQRYFLNDQYYKSDGPMFVFIGGEAPADIGWMTYGDWIKNAKLNGAMALQLEHRFYGESRPTNDASTSNLQWLSSEQALADLANFIMSMKAKLGMQNAKVIVFGGSYPGNLAAWFRLKYPHVADGAIASSAPVMAKANFQEYLEVVGNALRYFGGDTCYNAVQMAYQAVDNMVENGDGMGLKNSLRLCDVVNTSDPKAVSEAVSASIDIFMGDVQYNSNYPDNTVMMDCAMFTDTSVGGPLERLTHFISTKYGLMNSDDCIGTDYNAEIKELRGSDWTSPYIDSRTWLWQTCTEFGYYQGTDSKNQPFGHSMTYSLEMGEYCSSVFGISANNVYSRINQTNYIYGDRALQVSKVVLPNGSLDPWHALGILSNINPTALARLITATSHCYDMMDSNRYDSAELTQARQTIQTQIMMWLQQ